MKIAIVHGYILQGTGSNLYVTNLCQSFCKAGYEVMLFSQETQPHHFDFISQGFNFNEDCATITPTFHQATSFPGKCTHYRPFINHFLPVYVYDDYPGYTVKTYTEASEKEIEAYLSYNTKCLHAIFHDHSPDIILSQHTIMQPVYVARARKSCPHAKHFINVHGSALNFSVRKKDLLRNYALEGLKDAHNLIFVSHHSRDDFVDYFNQIPDLLLKCNVIPAGVNINLFSAPKNEKDKIEKLNNLILSFEATASKNVHGRTTLEKNNLYKTIQNNPDIETIKANISLFNQNTDIWSQDQDTQQILTQIKSHKGKIVLYFGKYLWTKGIHLLIAAAPLILAKHPDVHFILVGFGSTRAYLEILINLLDTGQIDLFIKILQEPALVDSEGTGISSYINDFLDWLSKPENRRIYESFAYHKIFDRINFTGIMQHNELINLLPYVDATVAPSIFPESFGMVGIESLACGVIPVQTYHSGFADVVDHYEESLNEFFSSFSWKHLVLNDALILSLSDNICSLLSALDALSLQERIKLSNSAHTFVKNYYDWDYITRKILSLNIADNDSIRE